MLNNLPTTPTAHEPTTLISSGFWRHRYFAAKWGLKIKRQVHSSWFVAMFSVLFSHELSLSRWPCPAHPLFTKKRQKPFGRYHFLARVFASVCGKRGCWPGLWYFCFISTIQPHTHTLRHILCSILGTGPLVSGEGGRVVSSIFTHSNWCRKMSFRRHILYPVSLYLYLTREFRHTKKAFWHEKTIHAQLKKNGSFQA